MGLWTLNTGILIVTLLCSSNGQRPRWQDRFTSIDRYWEIHDTKKTKDSVSSSPRFTLLTPDLLRADSEENIYLQAHGLSSAVTVSIVIRDFSKTVMILQDSVKLGPDNGFHALKPILLSSDLLNREEKKNKFVNMMVTFGGFHIEERVMMVSFHSGYIFIQTDKPIYNPGDTVRFRAFVSSPSFKAFDNHLSIEIQNSDGVAVKQSSEVSAVDGVYSDTFQLTDFVNEGTWIVTAKLDHWQQNTFRSRFEVKRYVLPAFNVTLTPAKSFLSLEDRELEVKVSARYLFGELVQGTAYVVFGVKSNNQMKRLPSVKQVSNLDGGVVRLTMEELRRAYPESKSLVGSSVYVKASVLTKSGSDLVEAERTGIKIVDSPFVLQLKDFPQYFKPGLPFDLTVQVSHHDGSPSRNVPVKLNLLDETVTVSSGSTRVTINMPSEQGPQTITAETAQAALRPDQQARTHIRVEAYTPHSQVQQNYLYISAGTNSASVGDRLSLKLIITTADKTHRDLIQQVTYLVLSKGRILSAERVDVSNQLITTVGLTVTADMLPSFRFVAFYSIPWSAQEEVVSDSIWIDVVDSCVGGLRVGPVGGVARDYLPGRSFGFNIKGDPGAKVSLVTVDNAVYLLNKDRLTQRKIWETVENGDMGCSHGGGRDAKGVFTDAGLFFFSSTGVKTEIRQTLRCPGGARRRRSADLLRRKAQLESLYKEKLENRCCKDALREVPMPYSCTRRSLYITEGWECMRAFRYCCSTYRDQVFDTDQPTTPPPTTTAPPIVSRHFGRFIERIDGPLFEVPRLSPRVLLRSQPALNAVVQGIPAAAAAGAAIAGADVEEEEEFEDLEYMDVNDVYLRTKFYESWLWMDVKLPSSTGADGLASKNVDSALPDSITEWGLLAVSASPQTGFCVAEPYNFRAWKEFFVDLKLPYSVAKNEQVEIKAVIHNYAEAELQVRVILMKTKDMCSVAFKDAHTQQLKVPAGSSVTVPYTIVPLVVGKLPIEVMVAAGDMMGGDRIQKSLHVVMDGVQKSDVWSVMLNPSAEGGKQVVRRVKVELESVVPNSVPETFINVRGNVLADSIDNSISQDSLASLIQMPGGCVEQNLASITLPLIATLYLDRTNDWETVGVQRKAEAVSYITRGYKNQLAYKRKDGSYPPYRSEGASTWITAYVVKVFSMAYSIIGVDEQHVCDPLLYLVNNKHRLPQGSFVEDNPVYSTTMTGGLRGDDSETTLTAFVLIALAEAKQAGIRCSAQAAAEQVKSATDKTAEYLRAALKTAGRRPYTVAIASYALALLDKDQPFDPTQALLRAAAPDRSHWPDRHNRLFTLEATGYALLALVKLGRLEEAAAPFKWLNSQRGRGGGFGSTQSTMVVLHALSEYLIRRPPPGDLSLDVDVRLTGRKEIRYAFNPTSAYAVRSSRLPANSDLEVEARGNGEGILEVVTYYNQVHEADEKKPCSDFELSVAIEESSEKPPAEVEKSYQLTIKVRTLGPRDVRMVVLDISLPTGFTPETSDLEKLSNSVDRYINNFQVVDNLSERGSLIIHLFKVSHKESEILMFRLQQNFKVGLLQPSSVTVYEYYNPDHRCSRTYSPKEDKEALTQICKDSVCRCTQGDCCISKADSEQFLNKEREVFACKSLHHVYQVKVLSVSESYYDRYEMEITRVIKLGLESSVEVGQTRSFLSHGGCRDGLNLKQGSQYLIMGPEVDQWTIDTETNKYIYMLGKDTWVELWPSAEEAASSAALQAKSRSLSEAAHELSVYSCRL
ncbi:complement C3-like [Betta splendens]|uniref:Complement C3-like n=1 Tax=Betta splendens TaxID=158456 RepID=A0A6P7NCE5_BETSP|nr:complement C3-like [Betta splendens]